jgi:hypothetical protein
MTGETIEPKRADRLKEGGGTKSSPLQYVADLLRLNMIADKVIGKEPLSRGTRESHFAEAWVHAVGHYDEPEREDCIKLDRILAVYTRLRVLSPHEEGKHIEVISRLLAPSPPSQVILGSPYDEPPEGAFSFLTGGKDKNKRR